MEMNIQENLLKTKHLDLVIMLKIIKINVFIQDNGLMMFKMELDSNRGKTVQDFLGNTKTARKMD
jgi:hypothetical protein